MQIDDVVQYPGRHPRFLVAEATDVIQIEMPDLGPVRLERRAH
jgi:hypothetical protein